MIHSAQEQQDNSVTSLSLAANTLRLAICSDPSPHTRRQTGTTYPLSVSARFTQVSESSQSRVERTKPLIRKNRKRTVVVCTAVRVGGNDIAHGLHPRQIGTSERKSAGRLPLEHSSRDPRRKCYIGLIWRAVLLFPPETPRLISSTKIHTILRRESSCVHLCMRQLRRSSRSC